MVRLVRDNQFSVMFHPRAETADGHEVALQTNYLGHALLVHALLPALLAPRAAGVRPARIVALGSVVHWLAPTVALADPSLRGTPDLWVREAAYCQSKLLCMLFVHELQRRLVAARLDSRCIALACHPGWSATRLMQHPSKESW